MVNASGHGVEDLKVVPWVCDGVSRGWEKKIIIKEREKVIFN